jgi:2-polyprenyl-6-methoxyphenol hydroxylase-like FAD-dependent oxidoreductase
VLVLGAGVAGLTTAIALARAGIAVEVLERDHTLAPAGRRGAGNWRRTGVPQANHAHTYSPECRDLLAEQLPDVLDRLHDLGARDLLMPGRDSPGLAVRRPVFDWVLRRVAEREPLLRVHDGVTATGVETRDGRLAGIRVSGGVVGAQVAVDATGAARPADEWLAAPGLPARTPSAGAPRVAYASRDYALHWPGEPDTLAAAGGAFAGYTCRLVPGDNNTFTVTLAVPLPPHDGQSPAAGSLPYPLDALAHPAGFDAAVSAVPGIAEWVAPEVADALGEVSVLACAAPTDRDTAGSGLPGLIAVGDALCIGDPYRGSGVATALASGLAAARAVTELLAGGEPALDAVATAATAQAGGSFDPGPEHDGPALSELTDLAERAAEAAPAEPEPEPELGALPSVSGPLGPRRAPGFGRPTEPVRPPVAERDPALVEREAVLVEREAEPAVTV